MSGATRALMLPQADAPWLESGVEPPLEDLLKDPLVLLLARSDGLSPGDLAALIATMPRCGRSGHRKPQPSAA